MNLKYFRTILAAGTAFGLSAAAVDVQAAPILFTGSTGSLAASVSFDVVDTTLTMVLSNTSSADVLVPADVLTGVYFSGLSSAQSLSAVLTSGSTVIYDTQPPGGIVGGEWSLGTGLSAPNGATAALTSTGAGSLVGQPTFPGDNLGGPVGLDGLQYGLVSAGDNPATGNGGVTGAEGLIQNSVTFTLGVAQGFSASNIGNVSFQYGTSFAEPIVPGTGQCPNGAPNFPICSQQQTSTPEPMSMGLLGTGMVALGLLRRRRRA